MKKSEIENLDSLTQRAKEYLKSEIKKLALTKKYSEIAELTGLADQQIFRIINDTGFVSHDIMISALKKMSWH